MTFSTKLIVTDRNGIEADVAAFLNSASPTTIHSITPFVRGPKIFVLIVYE